MIVFDQIARKSFQISREHAERSRTHGKRLQDDEKMKYILAHFAIVNTHLKLSSLQAQHSPTFIQSKLELYQSTPIKCLDSSPKPIKIALFRYPICATVTNTEKSVIKCSRRPRDALGVH